MDIEYTLQIVAHPVGVYTGRAIRISEKRNRVKEKTMKQRKQEYKKAIAGRQTMS